MALIIANLKSKLTPSATATLLTDVNAPTHVEFWCAPSFVAIDRIPKGIRRGAQDVGPFPSGAYTGDVSVEMLRDLGVEFCIVGHSERRKFYAESTERIAAKLRQLVMAEITPVLCVGEQLDDYNAGRRETVLTGDIDGVFERLAGEFPQSLVVAYEPVWAIGTGKSATVQDIREANGTIAASLSKWFPIERTKILYGGSVTKDNAPALLEESSVQGFLVGSASQNLSGLQGLLDSVKP